MLYVDIGHFYLIDFKKLTIKWIEVYSINIVIKYVAINIIITQSSFTLDIYNFIINNNKHNIRLLI